VLAVIRAKVQEEELDSCRALKELGTLLGRQLL
jgi:hypothetical protein